MAKGNLFLSQARGKVGSVVFSVVRGQQIERVHNARPANPRTLIQQAQRALLANMTKFYKRGAQSFYKFAFEDKTIRESDFNAFARHNTQNGVYMPRELYDHEGTPALGSYQISQGSIATNIQDYFSGENYLIVVPGATAIGTIGSLSAALITQSPQITEGDIFTMVLADSDFGADMQTAGEAPTWRIIQFYIDPSDLRALSAVGLSDLGASTSPQGRMVGVSIVGVDRASFGAVVISRNTSAGLKVTNSYLKGSAVANVLFDWLRGDYMKRVAAVSWGGNPEAVLQGGKIATLPEVTRVLIGGGADAAAYSYGVFTASLGSNMEVTLTGSNLRSVAQGAKYTLKLYNADILEDGLVTTPVISIDATGSTGSTSSQVATFGLTGVATGEQMYALLAVDEVPVWYGLLIAS